MNGQPLTEIVTRASPLTLQGANVLVTGAGRGIGRETARSFAALGAVVVAADLDGVAAQDTAELVGGGAVARSLDVTDRGDFEALVAEVSSSVGPIDVLVNNAGIMPVECFVTEEPEVSRRTVEVNLMGPIHGMRAVLPGMYERGHGHVVNVASMAGKVPAPGLAVYNASKFGVVGLSAAVRMEAARAGVSVTAVLPSAVNTGLISGIPRVPLLPQVEPADVAAAIVASCSHRRAEVHVPRWLRAWPVVAGALPERVLTVGRRLLREDEVLGDIDHAARADYQRRIDEQLPSSDR